VLVAEDLGSANGLFADRGSKRLERVVLDGDRPIRIGHTYVRVRDAAHPVAPERVVRPTRRGWLVACALCTVILGIEALDLWLGDFTEGKPSRYLLPLLYVAMFVAVWSAAWSVLARIFSGHAQVERNLLITLAFLLAWSLYTELSDFSGFALSWRWLAEFDYVAMWSLLAVACFLHLWSIRPTRLVLKAGLVVALAAGAIVTQVITRSDAEAAFDRLVLNRPLKPPALRLIPLGDAKSLLANLDRLRDKVIEDRRSQVDAADDFDDDD
jgi:hypothetical protein